MMQHTLHDDILGVLDNGWGFHTRQTRSLCPAPQTDVQGLEIIGMDLMYHEVPEKDVNGLIYGKNAPSYSSTPCPGSRSCSTEKAYSSATSAPLVDEFFRAATSCVEILSPETGGLMYLGSGSISKVFRTELKNKQQVAAKILRVCSDDGSAEQWPHFTKDFVREHLIVSQRFDHPNITKFVGTGVAPRAGRQLPVILYEYMPGGSVELVMEAKSVELGRAWMPPREQSLSWSRQLLSSLAFLHTLDSPIAHRDIKPANLLLSQDLSTLKLADFSLAKHLNEGSSDISTIPSVAGSFRYMAPEVFQQNCSYSLEKADVYSAAMTCFYMIYGDRPFDFAQDPLTLMTVVRQGLRPTVPSKDVKVSAVLHNAWHPTPSVRPSASELEEQLRGLKQKGGGMWGKAKRILAKAKSF